MNNKYTVYLFRHGITTANEQKRYVGWTDVPLNETGRNMTLKTKQQLQGLLVNQVYASDLKRCIETAELLFPDQQVHEQFFLREMYFGKWENQTFETLKNASSYQRWVQSPFTLAPEEGEDFSSFTLRVNKAWGKIKESMLEKHFSNIAIVTHGGVIRSLLQQLVASERTFFDWKIPYSMGYAIS